MPFSFILIRNASWIQHHFYHNRCVDEENLMLRWRIITSNLWPYGLKNWALLWCLKNKQGFEKKKILFEHYKHWLLQHCWCWCLIWAQSDSWLEDCRFGFYLVCPCIEVSLGKTSNPPFLLVVIVWHQCSVVCEYVCVNGTMSVKLFGL